MIVLINSSQWALLDWGYDSISGMIVLRRHMWDVGNTDDLITDIAIINCLKEKFDLELYEDVEFYILVKGKKYDRDEKG